jgi:hypothetical protein
LDVRGCLLFERSARRSRSRKRSPLRLRSAPRRAEPKKAPPGLRRPVIVEDDPPAKVEGPSAVPKPAVRVPTRKEIPNPIHVWELRRAFPGMDRRLCSLMEYRLDSDSPALVDTWDAVVGSGLWIKPSNRGKYKHAPYEELRSDQKNDVLTSAVRGLLEYMQEQNLASGRKTTRMTPEHFDVWVVKVMEDMLAGEFCKIVQDEGGKETAEQREKEKAAPKKETTTQKAEAAPPKEKEEGFDRSGRATGMEEGVGTKGKHSEPAKSSKGDGTPSGANMQEEDLPDEPTFAETFEYLRELRASGKSRLQGRKSKLVPVDPADL